MSAISKRATRRSRGTVASLLATAAAALGLGAATPAVASAACPNEAVREQQGATFMPECRGFELVSGAEKNDEEVSVPGYNSGYEVQYQASTEGPSVAYMLNGAIPESQSGAEFVQALGIGGPAGTSWSQTTLAPSTRFGTFGTGGPSDGGQYSYFSPTLACAVEQTALAQPTPGNEEVPLMAPGESPDEEIENIYVRDSATGNLTLVTNERPHDPLGLHSQNAYFVDGVSTDCGHIVFEEEFGKQSKRPQGNYELPTSPTSGEFAPIGSLYQWSASAGELVVASVLPDGSPAENVVKSHAGGNLGGAQSIFHELSTDGKRLYFAAQSNEGKAGETGHTQIFLRENGTTRQVSTSETSVPDGNARFEAASTDGSRMFFIANYGLTSRSSAGAEAPTSCKIGYGVIASESGGVGCDLYEYEVTSGSGKLTDLSTDVEAETGDTKGANVRGVLGISEDGSYVYLSSTGQLVPGEGNSGAVNEAKAEANVYAYHEGQLSYVTTISQIEAGGGVTATNSFEEMDGINTSHGMQYMASRVSESGEYLLLSSQKKLTSYNNIDQHTGKADHELYEYRYTSGPGSVTCVSCDPSGAQPVEVTAGNAFQPVGPYIEVKDGTIPRNLLDDGRAFFMTYDPLVPQATTEMIHVYEWQPAGFGGCEQAAGCVGLLDGGESRYPTYFEGASADGEHVYITTPAKLIEQDPDGLRDLYDVRVGGGELLSTPGPGCEANGEECQGIEGGRLDNSKRTSEASGEGNPPLPVKGGTGEVESFVTGKVAVKQRSHHGATITLVIAAPGKGRITVSGASVRSAGKSVGALGSYTVTLTLGAKAKSAIKHHKKVKVKLHVAFRPANGDASSADVTITV